MKKTIETIMRFFAPPARIVAMLFAVCAAGSVLAAASPKATVVWNGDFGTAVKTGYDGNTYTFTLNPGNTGDSLNTLSGGSDGNLVIGSGSTCGGQIAWDHDPSQAYTSVIIKYSNLTAVDSTVLAAVSAKMTTGGNAGQIVDDCVGVLSAAGSTLTGRYNANNNTWPNNGNSVATSYASGYLLIVYGSGQAFQFYTSPDGATWNGGTASGLTFSTTYSCGVGLGGMSGLASASGYGVSAGMTIEAVAIFRGYSVSTSDVSKYSLLGYFTSSSYDKWYYAKDVFTWHSDNATQANIGSSGSKVTLFSPTAGADTSVNYNCGGNTGYSGSDFWNTFCYGKNTYYTPGCVLRVTSNHASKQIKADFNPLTLGGLIIESGADGVDFYNDTSSRQTILGAATGNKETWFGIYDNATISRSGYLKLSGTVNLEVSKGKTFTISAANSPTIVEALTAADGTSTSGGVLKMHGLGTLAVSTLTATGGATLDFSDVQEDADVVRSTTPFIQGNLTIDSTTKFVFPAGLAKETAYTLCSGTLTAPASVICDITVGTTVIKNVPLTFSGNTVSYGDPVYAATVDGTTVTWDDDEPESYDGIVVTFSGTGTVTGLSGAGTTINAAAGVTVDVTNFTSPTLLGAGTFRWTANYPTTVPTGDFSYEYVGTGVSTEIANVTANGYLKTSGNIALASFTLSSGATLEVESGMTMVQAKQQLALSGNITIDSGATFSNLLTANGHDDDAVNYDQQGMKIIVRGTLAMGSTRWSLRQKSYHEFMLYDGAQITGTGDGNGALDWIENCGGQLDTYGGTVTISANMKVRSGATTANWVASGATCKFTGSTWGDGGFSKSGAGTLSFEGTHTQTGGVSASDGTIALKNISMTSSTITLSSAQNSPTLKMIATDAATTVSATVNVPANTRGQLAFEGAGTFALSGPNRNNNIVWLGTNLAEGALNLAGDVTINNGSRGGSYVFNKVIGSGTLTLSTWEGCYNSNDNGLTYTINTIDADSFAGAIALKNVAAPNRQDGNNDCTLKFAIGDIEKSSAVYGTAIVGLTTNITAGAHGVNSIDVDLSSTTFNNSPATFLYDGSTGIYLAEASYGGVPYKTLAEAVGEMVAAEGDAGDITVYNSAATIPSGYALVTDSSTGAMSLRTAGGNVYYTNGYWSSSENSFTVVTSSGGATTVASGDTVVVDSHATGDNASVCYFDATLPANVTAIKVDKNYTFEPGVTDAILGGATVAVTSGNTLTFGATYRAVNVGDVTLNGPGAVTFNGSNAMTISGAVSGTAGITVAANKTVTVASVGSIANAVTLESGASLVVQSGATVPTPTTTVANSYVKATTSDGTTTYAVDAYNTVTITGATATRTDGLGDAIKDGATITFTLDAGEGYAVDTVMATSGEVTESDGVYSYTVTQDATITVTTVSTSLTIGAATVEYLADYSKAKTVSATVTAGTVLEGTEWTLKTNGVAVADATGTYANGTVTFSNISVTLGDSITYSIEASNGSTGTSVESAASTVGNVTGGWIVEDKDNSGSTGAWTTDLTYTDGVATITDANTYTPTKPGDGIVTLETVVKFGNEADSEVAVGDGAQGAVKIANGKFAVYGKTASDGTAVWQSTTVDANVDATYTVKLIINYNTGTFTVSVKTGADAATALGDTWYLATEATKVSSIAYKGTGAFTSLTGSFISGDVDVTVDETGVAVSGDFISKHLAGKTVAEAALALAPDATPESNPAAFADGGNGINYFKCYALGLDPTDADDKPIVSVTTDAEGNYKVSVTDKDGNKLKTPANISVTPKFYKYTPDATEPWGAEAQNATLSPGDIVGEGNVGYIRAKIEINAK